MSALSTWLVRISNLLVGGTGVVYAVMLYALEPAEEWAVVNHPWQPHAQHLHVLVAPLLVFAVGVIWNRHVAEKLRGFKNRGRASGLALVVAFAPMALSGYLIQVAVSPSWRSVWAGLHVATSALWLVAAVVHHLAHRRRSETPEAFRPMSVNPHSSTTSEESHARRAS